MGRDEAMDHHDWTNWPEDDPDLGAADTTDLSDPAHSFDAAFDEVHLHGAGDHDGLDGLDSADESLPVEHLAHTPIGYGDLSDQSIPDIPDTSDTSIHDSELSAHDDALHADPVDVDMPAHGSDHIHTSLTEVPVGADPDAEPASHLDTGDLGPEPLFPPALDLPAPEPVDGYPWSDPGVLGDGTLANLTLLPEGGEHPGSAELLAYAGLDDLATGSASQDHWALLLASDDPATSALARWWSPRPLT
jgi:hypothetical protein